MGKDLQGHAPVQIDINSPVYQAHTASRDQFLDTVMRCLLATLKGAKSLRGHFDRLAHTTNRRQKSVPLSSYRLDVGRVFGRVRQRRTKFIDSGVDAVFKIDDRAVWPEAASDFLAGNAHPPSIHEQLQAPQRVSFDPP